MRKPLSPYGLKGLAWIDDAQVCAGYIEKWIAAGDEQPHVWMRIRSLDGNNTN